MSHINALHATQLAPPAIGAQVQHVYLARFLCISKQLTLYALPLVIQINMLTLHL